jgi:hypothetical protein
MSSASFTVRTNSGTCYFCRAAFTRGASAFYLTAKALLDAPERPLTPSEERQAKAHGREVAFARRNNRPLPTAPAWLWERMVHVACANGANFPTPGRETTARRGTRVVGAAHGVSVAVVQVASHTAAALVLNPAVTVSTVGVQVDGMSLPAAPAPLPTAEPSPYLQGMRDTGQVAERVTFADLTPKAAPVVQVAAPVARVREVDLDTARPAAPVNVLPLTRPRMLELD